MGPTVRVAAPLSRLADALVPRTPEELERRSAHLFALLLVAVVSTIKHVIGLTDGSAQYTLYALAIALSARAGGIAPGVVATMAAVLLADAAGPSRGVATMLFALEGVGLAALVAGVSRRVHETGARLAAAERVNDALGRDLARARIAQAAFDQLEDLSADAAVFVVNAHGLIVEWPRGAARLYGYTAEQMLGSDASALLTESSRAGGVPGLLSADALRDGERRVGVHRRADGTPVHVELAGRPCGAYGDHIAIAVHDLSGRRETAAFAEAALRAQTTLQRAVDEGRTRLDILLTLTDPTVSGVSGGARAIEELLERLRAALPAEGIALVKLGRSGVRLVASAGLRPGSNGKTGAPAAGAANDGRIVLVRNDAARVAQVSAVQWPSTVSSIVVVPVCQSGANAFKLEVVNERRASATEWDLALVRIVADRLASAVLLHAPADSADAVA